VADNSEALAKLEAQRAYFASDDRIRDRVALWRDATPAECLAATAEECAAAAQLLAMKDPDELAAVLAPAPIPADTVAILEELQRKR
jgi:hypothetical protein